MLKLTILITAFLLCQGCSVEHIRKDCWRIMKEDPDTKEVSPTEYSACKDQMHLFN